MKRNDLLTGILCLGVFTGVVNLFALIPVLTAIADEFGVSEARVGQLATIHALVAAIVAITAAPLMDRYSRRLILRVECSVLVLGTLISATAQTYLWLAAGRAVAGIGAAVIVATCIAIVGDLFPDEHIRNRRYGVVASFAALATVIGLPALTQIAAWSSWHWSTASIAVPALVVAAATWLLPARTVDDTASLSLRQEYVTRYRSVLLHRPTAALLAMHFLLASVINGMWLYFGAWTERDFRVTAGALSVLFLISGVCELVTSNVTPRILERANRYHAFVVEVVLLATSLLAVGLLVTKPWTLVPFVILISLTGLGLLFISTVLLIDSRPASPGAVLSVQAAISEFGAAGGAAIGGAGLAITDSYTTVYRLLGVIALVSIGFLVLSRRASAVLLLQFH